QGAIWQSVSLAGEMPRSMPVIRASADNANSRSARVMRLPTYLRESNSLDDLHRLERLSEKHHSRCGNGVMTWRCWGKGPPLILLHGAYGSWTHWLRNIEALATQCCVIAPDMPGFGDSDLPPDDEGTKVIPQILNSGLDEIVPPRQK